jgi:hypothetical protein
LETTYKQQLKGVGPIMFQLGCDFNCDKDGTLLYGPKAYIKKMIVGYKQMIGEIPKEYFSPLEKTDHPEFDESDLLSSDDIAKYQSMVGATQWTISLGRFDIQTAVMSMSHFRVAPHIGHLDRMKRIYGYLKRFKDRDIRVRTNKPDLSPFPMAAHNW